MANITNTDFALGTSYQLSLTRLPNVSFFSQSVSLPSVSLRNLSQGSPYKEIVVADSVLRLEPLRISFLIDRQFANYNAALAWILALGRTDDTMYQNFLAQYQQNGMGEGATDSSNGSLLVYATDNNPIVEIVFHGMIPSSLSIDSGVKSTSSDSAYLTATLSLDYTWFEINPLTAA